MRRSLAGLLALVPVSLLLLPAPARAAADPVPLDVAAVGRALLGTELLYRAPGAIAQLDPAVVLPELGPGGRVVLAPPILPAAEDTYPLLLQPLVELARSNDLDVLLVTGLDVQVLGGSRISQSDLAESRETLAYRDVTEPLRFAARITREPDYVDDVPAGDRHAAAPPALADQVVAGLRASPRYVAPGVDADLGDGAGVPTSLKVRVAALPVLRRGVAYPDLGPALAAAFPGEVVITLRGSWIEAVGPDPVRLESARNYLLGVGRPQLYQQAVPAKDLLRLLLQRLADLSDADPFTGRPEPAAATRQDEERGWSQLAVPVGLALALVAGGVALLWFGAPARAEPAPTSGPSFRAERARVYAALTGVAEAVARRRAADPYAARAAERHDTAVAWLERADATGDPQALRAAREAVEQADLELRRIGLS